MMAAVYTGKGQIRILKVPVPHVGPKEALIRVHSCGVCATDLKKISTGNHKAPLIFGHELAGIIVKKGSHVKDWKIGDRVSAYHHIPCKNCYYCKAKDYAQCHGYKKVGTTAGFKAAGGGFAEYVLAKDWIVKKGLTSIPQDTTYDEASFLEPINTCLKAINKLNIKARDKVLILGQGTVGLILLQLVKLKKGYPITVDPITNRLKISKKLGAHVTVQKQKIRSKIPARGVDISIIATAHPDAIHDAISATRCGGKILLFSQTQKEQYASIDLGDICVSDKTLIGSYSADIDLNQETARIIFRKKIKIQPLITHHFSLKNAKEAFNLFNNPSNGSLKVLIHPWEEKK